MEKWNRVALVYRIREYNLRALYGKTLALSAILDDDRVATLPLLPFLFLQPAISWIAYVPVLTECKM